MTNDEKIITGESEVDSKPLKEWESFLEYCPVVEFQHIGLAGMQMGIKPISGMSEMHSVPRLQACWHGRRFALVELHK